VLSRSFQRSRRLSSTVSLLTAAHAPYAKARSWSNKGMPQFRSSWCFPVNWRRCVLHARLKHSSGWEFVAKRPDLDLARTLAENSPAGTVAGQPTRPDRRSGPQSEGWFGPILLACSSKARVQLVRTSDRSDSVGEPEPATRRATREPHCRRCWRGNRRCANQARLPASPLDSLNCVLSTYTDVRHAV